jgi:hypothetical protein
MPGNLNGPGVGLPFPQNLYPSELQNAPQDGSSNRLALAPGDTFVIPAGDWIVTLGMYCILQFLDPVTNVWATPSGAAWTRGMQLVSADGFNVRVANLTGCVISASVINPGTGYVQATTTITAIAAGFSGAVPTLLPIIGGALNISGGTLAANGAGYGVPPIVMIPPPPPAQVNANGVGGIPATAFAVISSGTVSSISITNPGAGYPVAPVAVIVPSPFDPNLSVGITNATVAFTLASAGLLMGALVTNNGSPLANGSLGSVTLSIGGAGSSGSLTANVLQTVVSGTLSSAGTGYGTGGVGFVTYGGAPLAGTITNSPEFNGIAFEPRPANIAVTAASVSLAAPATIYDGGLFESAPGISVLNVTVGGVAPTTIAALAAVMGSRNDTFIIQPGP